MKMWAGGTPQQVWMHACTLKYSRMHQRRLDSGTHQRVATNAAGDGNMHIGLKFDRIK